MFRKTTENILIQTFIVSPHFKKGLQKMRVSHSLTADMKKVISKKQLLYDLFLYLAMVLFSMHVTITRLNEIGKEIRPVDYKTLNTHKKQLCG